MAILVQDSFTDVDGTLLQNHIPDVGSNWIKATPLYDISIQGNKANGGLIDISLYFNNLDNEQNVYSQGVLTGTSTIILICRFLDIYNYYYAMGTPGNFCFLVKVVNGIESTIASINSGSSGLNQTFRFACEGTTLKLYKNSIEVLSVIDTDINTGRLGFGLIPLATIDKFVAGTLASPPSPPSNLTLTCGI